MPDVPKTGPSDVADFSTVTTIPEPADFGVPASAPSDVADFGTNLSVTPQRPKFDLAKIDWSTLKKTQDSAAVDFSQFPQAQDASASAFAAQDIEKLYGVKVDPGQLKVYSDALWPGQDNKPWNVIERIGNTLSAAELNRERSAIGGRIALGVATPADMARLKEIDTVMPSPEDQLKAVPKAFLDFAYNIVVGLPNTIVSGLVGPKTPTDNIAKDTADRVMASLAGLLVAPWNAPQAIAQGPVGRTAAAITEDAIGQSYLAMTDNGVDPNIAKGFAIGLGAVNTALTVLPIARGAMAGVGLFEKIASQAITRSLVSGTAVRAALAVGEQGLYGYGLATINAVVPNIAAAVSNAVTGGQIDLKSAQEVLTQIGIEGSLSTLVGSTLAGISIGVGTFKAVKGGALDLALKQKAREAEAVKPQEPAKAAPTPEAKPYVPPAPGEQKIGDIIAMTDAEALKLDQAVKSAESSADYIQTADMPAKQAVQIAIDEYKAKIEAKQLTNKYISDIAKVDTTQMRPELAEPVQKILDNFTLENFRKDTVAKLNTLKEQLQANPEMDLPAETLRKLGELDKTPLKSLSVDDLKTIHDSILHYWWLQKDAQRVMFEGRAADKTVVVDKITQELPKPKEALPETIKAEAGLGTKISDSAKMIADTVGQRAERVGLVADRVSPTLRKAVVDPLMEGYRGQDKYDVQFHTEFSTKTQGIRDAVGDLSKWFGETELLPLTDARGRKVNVEASRAYKLALYMHSLNADNRRHLIDGGVGFKYAGRGLKNRVFKIDEPTLNAIAESVKKNPQEMQLTQTVADLLDRMGKDQARVYLEQNGIPLQLVDNYYHIETMPIGRGKTIEEEAISTEAKKEFYGIGQSKGHLKERVESSIPIYLNPITYDLAMSEKHASAYVNLEPALRSVSRILGDKKLKQTMEASIGETTHRILVKAAKDVAGVRDPATDMNNFWGRTKNRMSTGLMAIPNIYVPLKQPAAFIRYNTSGYVRIRYLMEGLVDSIMHPKQTELALSENSALYARRSITGRSREAADVLKASAPGSEIGGKVDLRRKLMSAIGYFDTRGSVRPGMRGAVLQVIDDLTAAQKNGTPITDPYYIKSGIDPAKVATMTPDEIVKAAFRYADYATEQTQTSGNPLLQSDIQRGKTSEQVLTTFMSEGFTAMNLRRQAFLEAQRANTPQMWGRFAKVMIATLLAEPMYEMAVNRLRRVIQEQQQPALEKEAAYQVANALFSGIPVANQVVQSIAAKAIMGWNISNNSITPLDNLVDVGVNALNLAMDPKSYRTLKGATKLMNVMAEFGSLATGYPVLPAVKLGSSIVKKLEPR